MVVVVLVLGLLGLPAGTSVLLVGLVAAAALAEFLVRSGRRVSA